MPDYKIDSISNFPERLYPGDSVIYKTWGLGLAKDQYSNDSVAKERATELKMSFKRVENANKS